MKIPSREDYDVDYKLTPNSVKPKHIVAFANSTTGGLIIVGVKEDKNKEEFDENDIVGCKTTDEQKQIILNSAMHCIPPVHVEIETVEHRNGNLFYVHIPSSLNKPHCTQKGTYKIRGDGRSNPLDPLKMLEILMEREQTGFLSRFKKATSGLEDSLRKLQRNVKKKYEDLFDQISQFEIQFEQNLDNISGEAQDASAFAQETEGNSIAILEEISEIKRFVEYTDYENERINRKINALLFGKVDTESIRELVKPEIMKEISHLTIFTDLPDVLPHLEKKYDFIPLDFLQNCLDEAKNKSSKKR